MRLPAVTICLVVLLAVVCAQPQVPVFYAGAIMRGSYLQSTAVAAVWLTQETPKSPTLINVTIYNIPPGTYGFHIHSYGDLTSSIGVSNISTSAEGVGTHFNPENVTHGCPQLNQTYHVGDIGNVEMTGNPTSIIFKSIIISLAGDNTHSVIGRSIILHSARDQCIGATGNAMIPWMSGVIGILNPESNQWLQGVPPSPINVASATLPKPLTEEESFVAVLFPLGGEGVVQQAAGIVRFTTNTSSLTTVTIRLIGVEPLSVHGFHVHQYGDDFDASIAPFNKATAWENVGPHFNPFHANHSYPGVIPRHAGDMGNVTADEKGIITETFLLDLLDLGVHVPLSILGRAVAIHALADDGVSQPSGAAGARIFVGIIGFSAKDVYADLDNTFPKFPIVPPSDSDMDYSAPKKNPAGDAGAACD